MQPCDDPHRQELITITVADFKSGEHYTLFYRILRPAGGLDLVFDERFSADRFEDRNMQAVLHALLDRVKHGTVPDLGGMEAYEFSQKEPIFKRVK